MLKEEDFTPAEKFVWEQVRKGEPADFNEAEGFGGELKYPDPKEAEKHGEVWPESRILRADFLETLLFSPEFRDKIQDIGINIFGGWIQENLNFYLQKVTSPFVLFSFRIEGNINAISCEFLSLFSLDGSWIEENLNMNGALVRNSLTIRDSTILQQVEMTGIKICGQLNICHTIFKSDLNLNSAKINHHLLITSTKLNKDVTLTAADIGKGLDLSFSTYHGKIVAEGLRVGEHMHLKSSILLSNNFFDFALIQIGGSLRLSSKKPEGIGLPSINLSGATIKGELDLGTLFPISWQENVTFNLRNASIGNISARLQDWPDNLKLDGFRYEHLGGIEYHEDRDPGKWSIEDIKNWLVKQGTHSPDPYRQMARVLEKQGHSEKAEEVLYAGMEETRKQVKEDSKGKHIKWSYWWLSIQNILVGYGFRKRWALGWMFLFWMLGSFFLCIFGEADRLHLNLGIGYSLDMLMPIMRLNAMHYTKGYALKNNIAQWYFYIHQIMGYVLVTFLIAGLSGVFKDKK